MVWTGWDLRDPWVPALLYGRSCPLLWTWFFKNIVKARWIFEEFDFYLFLKFLQLEKRNSHPKQATFYTEDTKTVKFSEVAHRNLPPLQRALVSTSLLWEEGYIHTEKALFAYTYKHNHTESKHMLGVCIRWCVKRKKTTNMRKQRESFFKTLTVTHQFPSTGISVLK